MPTAHYQVSPLLIPLPLPLPLPPNTHCCPCMSSCSRVLGSRSQTAPSSPSKTGWLRLVVPHILLASYSTKPFAQYHHHHYPLPSTITFATPHFHLTPVFHSTYRIIHSICIPSLGLAASPGKQENPENNQPLLAPRPNQPLRGLFYHHSPRPQHHRNFEMVDSFEASAHAHSHV